MTHHRQRVPKVAQDSVGMIDFFVYEKGTESGSRKRSMMMLIVGVERMVQEARGEHVVPDGRKEEEEDIS